jgi:hypothetical protein
MGCIQIMASLHMDRACSDDYLIIAEMIASLNTGISKSCELQGSWFEEYPQEGMQSSQEEAISCERA